MSNRDVILNLLKQARDHIKIDYRKDYSKEYMVAASIEELNYLCIKMMNEAYERAAQRSDAFVYMSPNFETLSLELRSMKQDLPK